MIRRIYGGVAAGIFFSTLVHAGVAGGLYYLLAVEKSPRVVAELDLSIAPLAPVSPALPSPPLRGAATRPKATQTEILPKRRAAPLFPVVKESPPKSESPALPVISEPPKSVEAEERQTEGEEAPSAPPEPSSRSEEGLEDQAGITEKAQEAADSSPGATGRYLLASQVARPPRWIGNLIRSSDYPRMARREGKDGRVILAALIDEAGRVEEVRLLEGSYDVLNEVALRKVRAARFTPAYDRDGRPVACKIILPIRFQLQ